MAESLLIFCLEVKKFHGMSNIESVLIKGRKFKRKKVSGPF